MEEIEKEIKKCQDEYGKLCWDHGHITAQVLEAKASMEANEETLKKVQHSLKQIIKRIKELNTKMEFEKAKKGAKDGEVSN